MKNKVSIIGAGCFGTSITQIFSDKDYKVMIYARNENIVNEINNNRTNKYYFNDFIFSDKVEASTSLEKVLSFSKYIIMALPSGAVREICIKVNEILTEPKIFINVAKGLEPKTNKLLSEIMEEEISVSKRKGIVILSGPSHSEEIIERKLTALVSVSKDELLSKEVQYLFSNKYIRVYTSNDLLGVQLAATTKNVLAIASGILSGMGFKDNTRALLISRGLAEMTRHGLSKGAKIDTFFGLAGIGDLIVTATSYHSRNFKFGYKIGKGMSPKKALSSSKTVVEGVRATEAVYLDAEKYNIDMPITRGVYKIIFENIDPLKIIEEITNRELKAENISK